MKKSFWISITLATGLVVLELVLRALGFGSPLLYRSSASAYEPQPEQVVRFLGATTTINRFGTRGPERTPEPSSGVARIMVLGDSVANGGLQASDGETMPAQLEQQLRAHGCRAEVINASAGGWSIPDERAWVDAHGTLGSRLVLLTLNGPDLVQPANSRAAVGVHPSLPVRDPPLAVIGLARRYVLPRLGMGPSAADAGSTATAPDNPAVAAQVRGDVLRLQASLAAHGIELAIAYHRSLIPLTPARARAEQALRALARGHAIPLHDIGLPAQIRGVDAYRDPIHPSAPGNRWIGEKLAGHLRETCRRIAA